MTSAEFGSLVGRTWYRLLGPRHGGRRRFERLPAAALKGKLAGQGLRSRLLRKYIALFVAVVSIALLTNGPFEIWFSYHEHKAALLRIQREQADAAAAKIAQFIKEIESQVGWTTQLPWSAGTIEQRRFDGLRLLRQVPAITELAQLDASGREQLRVSRLAMDVVGSQADFSNDPKFTEAVARKVYYGSVYFRRESEPYMTLAMAGARRDAGVSVAEVNLKLIWDVISQIKVGEKGHAYVVGPEGRLIAHPDISLVLRNTDMSRLPQVQAARAGHTAQDIEEADDIRGRKVLIAHAAVAPLGWLVFVELPVEEAYAPLNAAIRRSAVLLLAGLGIAFVAAFLLARKMMVPIQALRTGAANIGAGDLGQRISIKTGDELEDVAGEFNRMAEHLQESYATLEKKVEVRTSELSESLQQQTATADVLKVISRSTFDLQTVLDTLVESAARLCEADSVAIHRPQGEAYYFVASYGFSPEYSAYMRERPLTAGRGTVLGRTVLEAKTVQVADVTADPEYTLSEGRQIGQFRTVLGVPLLRGGAPVGVMMLTRSTVRPFTEKQIELLTTFADQAVIAIENVRLFDQVQARTRELTESLEQQTATSEVLRVISSAPGELQPVFDALLSNATRICEAKYGILFRYQHGAYHAVAKLGVPPEYEEFLKRGPVRPGPTTGLGRLIASKQTVHVTDALAEPAYGERDPWRVATTELGGIRTFLNVPMLKEGELIGAIGIYREHVRPFSDKQIELVTAFAAQAVIAIENTRLLKELRQRTDDLTESLEQQTATGEILSAISSSLSDTQPVFDAIVQSALKLFSGAAISIAISDGENVNAAAIAESDPARAAAWRSRFPFPLTREYMHSVAILDRKIVDIPDVENAPPEFEVGKQNFLKSGYRAITIMPMMRGGVAIGALSVVRLAPGALSDKHLALLKTFANQAVIAIENTRLLNELRQRTDELGESLEFQTATSEVLQVIGRSTSQLQPVVDAIVQTAVRLCEAEYALVFKLQDGRYHPIASNNAEAEFVKYAIEHPVVPDRGSLVGRAALDRRTIHLPDCLADPDYTLREYQSIGKFRSTLGVPLLREGVAVGVIALMRATVKPFTQKQIELVTTFADQALIAIENVRLFDEVQARTRDLQESLEFQTATSEVLNVISRSPSNVQPVLDTIADTAQRLCQSKDVYIFLRTADDLYHLAACKDATSEQIKFLQENPLAADRSSVTGRVALERHTIHLADCLADPEYKLQVRGHSGYRTILGVPLLREGAAAGVIILTRPDVQSFSAKQVGLVTTFADQAVIAIENARLFDEVQARTRELSRSVEELQALGEVSQAVNSSLEIKSVLQSILLHACTMADSGGGAFYVYDKARNRFELEAHQRMSKELVGAVGEMHIRMGQTIVGKCAQRREAVQIEDLTPTPDTPLYDVLMRAGIRALLAVPLLHQNDVVGALVVRRKRIGAFAPETVRLLQSFAAQSATAIHNARLFQEVQEKSHQLEVASQHKSQFLANMSHELRTPLNAVLGYAELIQDGIYGEPNDKTKSVLGRIQANGKHLLGLINEVLDLSKIEAGQLKLSISDYSLSDLVQTVIQSTEPLATEKRIGLSGTVPGDLPIARGDERRISQVLFNLVGNAIKFTDTGKVEIKAHQQDGYFHVAVSDTGPGIPEDEVERIFQEFHQVDSSSTRKKGGTGLGLAIAKRIIELHHGRIWVESIVGRGSTFNFTLPVRADERKEAA